jgi:hypothetical protein
MTGKEKEMERGIEKEVLETERFRVRGKGRKE